MKFEELYNIVRLRPINSVQVVKFRMPEVEGIECPWSVDYVTSVADLQDYRYFWFETVKMTKEYFEGGVTVQTEVVAQSGKFFVNAYIEEYDDVVVNNQGLAKQMENLGWTHIAKNIGVKSYWTEVFDPNKDKVVDFNGV